MAQCPVCSAVALRLGKRWHCLACNRTFTVGRKRKTVKRSRKRYRAAIPF